MLHEVEATPCRIEVEGTGVSFSCRSDETVLGAMHAQGRGVIPIGCRGGGCGICKVEVVEGTYVTGKMSRAKVSEAEQARGIVLACRLSPQSDLRLRLAAGEIGVPWRKKS